MSSEEATSEEVCLLTPERAKEIAESVKGSKDALSSKRIPPSLLSSEDIERYVLATGLISPFFKGGDKSRLKKASYEGRIGSIAYTFNGRKLDSVKMDDGKLRVAANSIVFVECDLDFRLPEYIALRFNLQIKHVHRGLLLGTGPLIDPGYWGKLCIPLHNLTNEDYYISKDEGLIWIDFTKTTSKVEPSNSQGRKPTTTDTWDIKKYILKAAESNGDGTLVAIQSSINEVVKNASESAKMAQKSANAAKLAVFGIAGGGFLAGAFALYSIYVGVQTLATNQQSTYESQHQIFKDYVRDSTSKVESFSGSIDDLSKKYADLQVMAAEYSKQIGEMRQEIDALTKQNSVLNDALARLNHSENVPTPATTK